jgi:hypothetical protein
VYNWKHSTFWPLIITILNLPPTYRSKFCVGQFVIGLLTVTQGGGGETLLMHCLIEELLLLNTGIIVTTSKGIKYFLQVRLIQYLLDTPAAAKFFDYQDRGKAGCVYCGQICGKYEETFLRKTVFMGHRFLLPLDHYLRIFGQTGTCCPKHFYPTRLIKNNTETDINLLGFAALKYYEPNQDSDVVQLKARVFEVQGLCVETIQHRNNIERQVRDTNLPFSWFGKMDKRLFENYLYYLHCDLRPLPEPYDVTKRTEIYNRLCEKAMLNNTHVQGAKSLSPMSRLPYFNFNEQFCPVNCHVISNNVVEFFQNVKGTHDNISKQFSEKSFSFPWYYRTNVSDDNGSKPWNLQKGNRQILDAHINCILVPLGYSQEFQVENPFQQTDVLNMIGKFHVSTTLMELIMHWSYEPFDIAYKAFYLMLSKVLLQLMQRNNRTDDETLIVLDLKLKEIVALHEGLFPLGCQDFINHQLADLVYGIRIFGTLHCFNSFALERAGGIFKKLLKKGGKTTEIGIMNKYDKLEEDTIKLVYSKNIASLFQTSDQNQQLFDALNSAALIDNLDKTLKFTDHRIVLHKESYLDTSISDDDICEFMNNCYIYILNKLRIQGYDDHKGTYESALFRVYYTFVSYRKKSHKNGRNEISFKEYFEKLKNITSNFSEFNDDTLKPYLLVTIREMAKKERYLTADSKDLLLVNKFWCYLKRNNPEKKLHIYKKADIYGIKFRGRNIQNANELKYNWSSADNYMSWAKIIDYTDFDDKNEGNALQGQRTLNSTDKFININYFFRIAFKEEPHLHGVAFANGTSRVVYKSKAIPDEQWKKPNGGELTISPPEPSDEENFLEHVLVGAEDISMIKESFFVPCVYFYASKVMIIPYHVRNFQYPYQDDMFHNGRNQRINETEEHQANKLSKRFRNSIKDAKPYYLRKKNSDIPVDQKKYYANCSSVDINFLTMILMHPAKCVDYLYNDLLLRPNVSDFISRFLHNSKLDRHGP